MPSPAISYAAVILADADVDVTADKLLALLNAANVEGIEPIVAQLYSKALSGKDLKPLLTAFASAAAAPAAAAGSASAAAGGAEAAAEEEAAKEESESDEDMGMGLFD